MEGHAPPVRGRVPGRCLRAVPARPPALTDAGPPH
jgi:hypothetical protein